MNTHTITDRYTKANNAPHKNTFVHLEYRKIMIDHLPLRELARRVKAAAVVLGAPVRVFFGGMARDRQGHLLDLTPGGGKYFTRGRRPSPRACPLLAPVEHWAIRPHPNAVTRR